MNDRFVFIGKLKTIKGGSITTKDFPSGWQKIDIAFRMVCGDNSQFLRLSAGKWSDSAIDAKTGKPKATTIYTFRKSEKGGKCEPMQVAWADRNKPEVVDEVAPFRKYTIDLDVEKPADDSARHLAHFIHPYDFINAINKVLTTDGLKDATYRVTGDIEYSYGTNKGMFYQNFAPRRIERVADNTEQVCEGTMVLDFCDSNTDAVRGTYPAFECNDLSDGYAYLNAYSKYRDDAAKKFGYYPYRISVPAKNVALINLLKKFLVCDNDKEVKEYGVNVKFINGAQQTEDVDMNTLTEEQKMGIEVGLITLDDIKAERKTTYGDRITAVVFNGPARGYSSGPVVVKDVEASALVVPPIAEMPSAAPTFTTPVVETPVAQAKTEEKTPSLEDLLGGTDIFDLT